MARILLVDDDAAMREFVKRGLEIDGHEVVVATEGAEVLSLLAAPGSAFDLLISDVQMPAMDGLSLARQIGRTKPRLPILLMSGFAVERGLLKQTGARVVGLVSKPFTLDDIRAQAKQALAAV